MKNKISKLLLGSLLIAIPMFVQAQSTTELKEGFKNPPQSARTRVWWHWMNGNITKEGIKKDLLWMHRIGLGGFQNFDAGIDTPPIVEKRLVYMDEGWKDAFAYATFLADSLNLEMAIASAPGWSATGGPWVAPKDAMKKLVWRTMDVKGGKKVKVKLPEGDKTTGAFQDLSAAGRGTASVAEYYEDICFMAVKLSPSELSMEDMGANVSASGGTFSLDQLTDGVLKETVLLPKNEKGDYAWIQYSFPKAQTIRSMTIDASGNAMELESSMDGRNFVKVCLVAGGRGSLEHVTLDIPETTARYFRLKIQNPRAMPGMFGPSTPAAPGTLIGEWILHPATRVNRAEDKAAFTAASNLAMSPTLSSIGEIFASTSDVIDVTQYVDNAGNLNWKAPKGNWRIFRFGFSLTGKQNHPAPPEATGLEVDKLDPIAWTHYFRTYFNMYKEAANGKIGQHGIQYVLTDSYEAEQETWTPAMFQEFKNRRGYDLHPWLPVLTGMVIESPAKSDAFLRDWRQTIGELITANYDLLSQIAKNEYGMKGRYTESHEGGRAYVVDGMDVKRTAEVPMSAMWVTAPWLPMNSDGKPNRTVYQMDDHESASVAHIYGQNIAAAESMTAPGQGGYAYKYHPGNLKETADLELSQGINRFVIHESAHQPVDDKVPGLGLMGIGQWFNRHDTWAEQAKAWVDYMSRSCYMLQQGKNVADILLYYGEDANITSIYNGRTLPAVPLGFQYDFCSPHALTQVLEAKDGLILSNLSGASYKLLWLDKNVEYMSLPVLRKIAKLAKSGVLIGGEKPQYPSGLMDSQDEFDALVKDVWESGRKNVTTGVPMEKVLKENGIEPDLVAPEGIKFLHRTLDAGEIYWINKPSVDYSNVEVSLRVKGYKPMLWHPETGKMEDVSYSIDGERTQVNIPMVPEDAVFLVLTDKTSELSYRVPEFAERTILTIETPWNVKFQQGRGAPDNVVFNQLRDFTENENDGIKYFSGTATYSNTIRINKIEGKQQVLKLGTVKNIAEVFMNGQPLGIVWKEPFEVDVTSALKVGENVLEIRVTNLWVNRLIGDMQPGAQKYTYADMQFYQKDSPLEPSGLIGPVQLVVKE